MLAVLRGVSRSFYLSIRLLPPALRAPVSVGYLLARASDTIADAPGLSQAQRLRLLTEFDAALRGGPTPAVSTALASSSEERKLLDALPRCFEWLSELGTEDQADVRTVLGHITRGQRFDVERPLLTSAQELDDYTYLVAGCVGEFWTRLGFRHVAGFASRDESEMLALGRDYGKALQLINVMRDADKDAALGRRYLPEGESRDVWLDRAQRGLASGMRYVDALASARIRVASALPAIIGARTLALLRSHGAGAKMARSEVRALLVRIALSLGSNASLQREFRRWDNRAR